MEECYLIPSAIILIANVFSDKPGGPRWEIITAIFGWLILPLFLIAALGYAADFPEEHVNFLWSCIWFCFITAISRDHEKILKPLADYFFNKRKK